MTSNGWAHLDRAVASAPITAGIYRIYNRVSKKSYVGQASNLRRRLGTHLRRLKQSSHSQPVLGKAFSKYGPEFWSFEVVETCPRTRLTEREQHHVEVFKGLTDGYNCAPIQSGVQVSELFVAIARAAAKKFHARVTDEERSQIALAAATTRKVRLAATERSLAAKKAWATRRARGAESLKA